MGHIRVNLPNTNNKWVEFELANVDKFSYKLTYIIIKNKTLGEN